MKETILTKMDDRFEKNDNCHLEMSKRIDALNVEFVRMNAQFTPMKNMLGMILGAVLLAIVGAVMTLILK